MSTRTAPGGIDFTRRYVRVTAIRDDGFIEFDYAVTDPEVFLEMIMKADEFDAFCKENAVRFLPAERLQVSPEWHWSLQDARLHSGRRSS